MLKKITALVLSSFVLINSLNAETVYAPAVTVTGGTEEADSLSGSGTYIGSDIIRSNRPSRIASSFFQSILISLNTIDCLLALQLVYFILAPLSILLATKKFTFPSESKEGNIIFLLHPLLHLHNNLHNTQVDRRTYLINNILIHPLIHLL